MRPTEVAAISPTIDPARATRAASAQASRTIRAGDAPRTRRRACSRRRRSRPDEAIAPGSRTTLSGGAVGADPGATPIDWNNESAAGRSTTPATVTVVLG